MTAAVRPYFVAFAVLAVLTAAEVGVVYVPGLGRGLLISALVLLAVAKAGVVLLVFMHLHGEARAVKRSILGTMLLPAVYALVLITEALWRR